MTSDFLSGISLRRQVSLNLDSSLCLWPPLRLTQSAGFHLVDLFLVEIPPSSCGVQPLLLSRYEVENASILGLCPGASGTTRT